MRGFNLPITIESRKIIYLDLQENSTFNEDDIFVVNAPESFQQYNIISIDKDKILQSITENEDDIPLSDLKFIVTRHSINTLSIELNLNKSLELNYKDENSELDLASVETDDDFRINVKGSQDQNSSPIEIIFQFLGKNDKIYKRSIKIYVIQKSKIYFAGLDFGSEASQIIEGRYSFNNIEPNFVDLFDNIKKNAKPSYGEIDNENFEQYEKEAGHKLFKSIFYTLRKIKVSEKDRRFKNSLKILTTHNDKEDIAKFNKEYQQIPNLKLIHNSTFAESIKFEISSSGKSTVQNESLTIVHKEVYTELLDEMLTSFLTNQITEAIYVRFTVLVPNIYTIEEINNTKSSIRRIFNQFNINSSYILGLEITSISESDAAFLGCNGYLNPVKGNAFYLCIDCGKGTTDFSIISSYNSLEFVPIYRNGFAGAGNLISYAIFESIKYFFYNEFDLTSDAKKNLELFLDQNLKMGENFIYKLYTKIEDFKKHYNTTLSAKEIDSHWKNAKSGNLTFEKLFSEDGNLINTEDFFAVLEEVKYIKDWGNFIETAYIDITNEIEKNISMVIDNLSKNNSKLNFSAVLMTGRGFLFNPFSDFLIKKLKNNKHFKNADIINHKSNNIDLKEICLQGIFTPNIKIHNDLINTPIEINSNNFDQIKKVDTSFISRFKNSITFFNWDNFIATSDYDLESNSLDIIQNDISKIRFLIGGRIFVPNLYSLLLAVKKLNYAKVICSRDGFYLIGDNDGKKIILPLVQTTTSINPPEIQKRVQKSLFPVYYSS
jgi:hypothetical protein